MNIPDITTPLGHRLTPVQMIEVARGYADGTTPTEAVTSGFLEGLIDLILLLPMDELTALRAELAPAPTLEEAA